MIVNTWSTYFFVAGCLGDGERGGTH